MRRRFRTLSRAGRSVQRVITVEEKEKSKDATVYLKWIPVGYLALILYSIIGSLGLYTPFGIDFFSFITLEELILLPISKISRSLSVVLALSFLVFLYKIFIDFFFKFWNFIEDYRAAKKKGMEIGEYRNSIAGMVRLRKKLTYYFDIKRLLILFWVLRAFISIVTEISILDSKVYYFLIITLILILLYTLFVYSSTAGIRPSFFILVYLLISVTHFQDQTINAQSWYSSGRGIQVEFQYQDSTYQTSQTDLLYVGNSRSYFFFYDKGSDKAKVFPISKMFAISVQDESSVLELSSIEH
ncbi:hypothetical protein [Roseivirga misakiensis]|uniref:Uncharacterized protein n=1 Tax=Roseivirga misakiensis TaxID=1563681 RepID=A0A1E5SK32_9BACT|nr:hypothetical protein [Roseivirga misakiensis]OEJ99480.1 hypothetical protein BFP71_07800 [Roseivirga misakiensis]